MYVHDAPTVIDYNLTLNRIFRLKNSGRDIRLCKNFSTPQFIFDNSNPGYLRISRVRPYGSIGIDTNRQDEALLPPLASIDQWPMSRFLPLHLNVARSSLLFKLSLATLLHVGVCKASPVHHLDFFKYLFKKLISVITKIISV